MKIMHGYEEHQSDQWFSAERKGEAILEEVTKGWREGSKHFI